MSWLALSDSFEYLCYGSTAIINIFSLTVWGSTLDVSICVYIRQIMTSKVDSRKGDTIQSPGGGGGELEFLFFVIPLFGD